MKLFTYSKQLDSSAAFQPHPFHLVDPSPWPLLGSLSGLTLTTGLTMYMHGYSGVSVVFAGLGMVIYTMYVWWRDIIREGTLGGHHSLAVQDGLKLGMILFIVSEVMFFVGFFWAFFHASIAPAIDTGAAFPPLGIEILNPFDVPLLNTILLLSSGASITYAHHAICGGNTSGTTLGFAITIVLATMFTGFQVLEYVEAPFTIADSVYGSAFFMATGFHGFHVFVGTIFIILCMVRNMLGQFTSSHHLGAEMAIWYWHFVDVVWLFLFVAVYWWAPSPF